MPEIAQFLEDLSSAEPVPGGGSAAALEAALAASLLAMVANLTLGRKRYADVANQARGVRDAALALRERARSLIQEDADAYGGVSSALALPREPEAARVERRRVLQEALKRAVVPPRDTMRVAQQIVQLAQHVITFGNKSAVSDVGVAVIAARSAYHSALLNVEINLTLIDDPAWTAGVRSDLGDAVDIDEAEREVVERVRRVIEGSDS